MSFPRWREISAFPVAFQLASPASAPIRCREIRCREVSLSCPTIRWRINLCCCFAVLSMGFSSCSVYQGLARILPSAHSCLVDDGAARQYFRAVVCFALDRDHVVEDLDLSLFMYWRCIFAPSFSFHFLTISLGGLSCSLAVLPTFR